MDFDLITDIALSNIEKPYAKIVLIELAKYSNGQGECFPSRDTLALGSQVPLRTVARSLKWLENNGHIKVRHRKGTSNFYVITCMEDEMTDDTHAKLAHEVVSNITILDTNRVSNTSRAKLAHPLDTEMFWAFWSTYPRRIGKGTARTAFAKATKFEDPNAIIQAALDYSKHCEIMGTERQFIPHPSTWLNQERWEDELETEMPQKKLGGFLDEL